MDPRNRSRDQIAALNYTRSIAIVFITFSHALSRFQSAHYLFGPIGIEIVRMVIRPMPAVFIILFGTLLEIAYARRARDSGIASVAPRLLQRAAQCYLLYAATIFVMLLTGQSTLGYAITCLLFMGITPYTEILKFYGLMCALAPVIIWARLRWGLAIIFLITALVQLAYPLIYAIPSPPSVDGNPALTRLSAFLIGNNDSASGPSILQGSFFVLCGMVVGRIIVSKARRSYGNVSAALPHLAAFGAILAVLAIAAWLAYYDEVTLRTFNDMSLRNSNHPFYFMASSAAAVLLLIVMSKSRLPEPSKRLWWLSTMGKNSLFAFSVGNIIILLMPGGDYGRSGSIALTLIAMIVVCITTALFDMLMHEDARASANPLVRIFATKLQSALSLINRRILAIIGRMMPRPAAKPLAAE